MEGLELRTATEADGDQIVALSRDAFGARVGALVKEALDEPGRGPGVFTVVADGDRIVSSLCLLDERLRLAGIELPVGQVEYVVTLPAYRRRGLVRAQFAHVHAMADARGDALTIVTGIPYFYRRLGYEYAIAAPATCVPGWGTAVAMPDGFEVREAVSDDLGALARLHETMQAASDLVWVRHPRHWRFQLEHAAEDDRMWVAVRDGEVCGSARLLIAGGRHWLTEPAAADLDAARALMSAALERLPAGSLAFSDRPGTPWAALLADAGVPIDRSVAVYVRVPDVPALLERLRPVLSRRLAASAFRRDRGVLEMSFYAYGVTLAYEGGEVGEIRRVEGVEEPEGAVAAVPPDLAATLILGRYGAAELNRRHDDVRLGDRGALVQVLFPRVPADVSLG